MREQLKQEHNLMVLRLYLDRMGSDQYPTGSTVFDLQMGGESWLEQRVDTGQLGVPRTLQDARTYRYHEPDFEVPAPVVQAIGNAIVPGRVLWLELAHPSGNLAMVPWERLLRPHLDADLLRLPHLLVPPAVSPGNPEVVLCASSPRAKAAILLEGLLEMVVHAILEAAAGDVLIHIFADQEAHYNLTYQFQGLVAPPGGEKGVRLYDPGQAGSYERPRRASEIDEPAGILSSPWLRWIADALEGRSVDAVHFVCHSYLSSNQGALAFAESPARNEDRGWARFIGAQQLSTFLNLVGASSVAYTAPPTNYSSLGARLLLDQLAHLRPGNLLLHDLGNDLSPDAIADPILSAYRFMLNVQDAGPPDSANLSLYCHPQRVSSSAGWPVAFSPPQLESTDLVVPEALTKGAARRILSSRENTPSWIVSSQRYFEQSAAKVLRREPLRDRPQPVREDVLDALSYLADVVGRHTFGEVGSPDQEPHDDLPGQEVDAHG